MELPKKLTSFEHLDVVGLDQRELSNIPALGLPYFAGNVPFKHQ